MFEKELALDYFKENGFVRRICKSCSAPFWTQDSSRVLCGDNPCDEYKFISKPIFKKTYTTNTMRETYLSYFERNGHTRIERYPVVARWRNDIYLTNASIADFQPHVTGGLTLPPANPLTISQPSIRLIDVDSVGKSGRHLTNFEMMAHHAFNDEKREIYWKEETVRLCHELLTKELQVSSEHITYKENPWSGGGNAGPAFEVLVGGLELGTLVFMNLRLDEKGEFLIKGERYSRMSRRIVDTGYGLERFVWASTGKPNIYDAIYPELTADLFAESGVIHELNDERYRTILSEHAKLSGIMSVDTDSKLRDLRKIVVKRLEAAGYKISVEELEKIMTPLENVYAIADHTRCIAFMLADGVVPSNVKSGYLARFLIRRTLRLMEEQKIKTPLHELVLRQYEGIRELIPKNEYNTIKDTIKKMLVLETSRYAETIEKGEKLIRKETAKVGKGGKISLEKLIEFYDTHGIPPAVVQKVAREQGIIVEVPDAFNSIIAERHLKASKKEIEEAEKASCESSLRDDKLIEDKIRDKDMYRYPPTKLLYYEPEHEMDKSGEFTVFSWKDGEVVLDATIFYPEGGGQPCDRGFLEVDNEKYEVVDVQKVGEVVVHILDKKYSKISKKEGIRVKGSIDWNRRMAHTRHHDATHLIIAASREVLGPHVWQTGSQNEEEFARLDITHYAKLTREELLKIEMRANELVLEDLPIEKKFMDRIEAEKKFGFRLYQGGAPTGGWLRITNIPGVDAEACGGTHANRTSQIGMIKIIKSERIQDGVERLVFSAGLAAVKAVQRIENYLYDSSEIISVSPENLPSSVRRFFEEWKSRGKEIEELKRRLGELLSKQLIENAEVVDGVRIITYVSDKDIKELMAISERIVKEEKVLLIFATSKGEKGPSVLAARSKDVNVNCAELVSEAEKIIGGKGGGRADFASGGGGDILKIEEGIKASKEKARRLALGI